MPFMITKKHLLLKDKILEELTVKLDQIEVSILNYGATITSLKTPNKDGQLENIVLRYQDINDYAQNASYLNAIIGPTSGRIKDGYIQINQQAIQLDQNFQDKHHLHGGKECFAFQLFDLSYEEAKDLVKVHASLRVKSEDSLYPGNKTITITYEISPGKLSILFQGESEEDTYLNMTSHLYFNLSGGKESILSHEVMIQADKVIEVDKEFLPSLIQPVEDMNLDMRKPVVINDLLTEKLRNSHIKGIDHPFILRKTDTIDASLYDPKSGRCMQITTSYPVIVCYTHNYPEDKLLTNQTRNEPYQGICFEAQYTPNPEVFPNLEQPLLKKDKLYQERTSFHFSIK